MATHIDKNVPLPTAARSDVRTLVDKMEYGDSVFVLTRIESNALRGAIAYWGNKPVSKKEGKGWRVWKMKREKPSNEPAS